MAPSLLIPDLNEFHPGDMHGIQHMNGGAAVLRISDGLQHLDRTTPPRRARAGQLGYKWLGLYQFVRPTQDLIQQADMFCHVIGKLGPHEIPIMDLELSNSSKGSEALHAVAWMGRVRERLGRTPWLYSFVSFVEDHGLAGLFNGTDFHTWIAAYSAAEPALGHTLWQSTNGTAGSHQTRWPGAGFCDTSVFHGTLDQLAAVTFPGQHHPAPPPPANGGKPVATPIPGAPAPIRVDSGGPDKPVKVPAGEWVTLHFPRRWNDAGAVVHPDDRAPSMAPELTGMPDHPRVLAGDVTLNFSAAGQATSASGSVRFTEHDHDPGSKTPDTIHTRVGFIGQDTQAAVHMVVGARCSARVQIRLDTAVDVSAVFSGHTLKTG